MPLDRIRVTIKSLCALHCNSTTAQSMVSPQHSTHVRTGCSIHTQERLCGGGVFQLRLLKQRGMYIPNAGENAVWWDVRRGKNTGNAQLRMVSSASVKAGALPKVPGRILSLEAPRLGRVAFCSRFWYFSHSTRAAPSSRS